MSSSSFVRLALTLAARPYQSPRQVHALPSTTVAVSPVLRPTSPHHDFIWQKFAAHRDLHAIAFRVVHFFDLHREIDRAHNAVAELFVDQFLDRLAIHQVDLVKTVKQRIFRNVQNISFGWELLKDGRSLRWQPEKRDQFVRLFGGHAVLTKTHGGGPDR